MNSSEINTLDYYIEGVSNGDITILSKAITLIESTKEHHKQLAIDLLDAIIPKSGNSFRLGVSGVPGVGKSTFIEAFGLHLAEKGFKIAVLAIDPSSTKTHGSILGDKTRMNQLAVHPNAFIRPTASAGNLGGVSRATYETILLCEAAGFDFIIIETVGVGQSEISVQKMTDFFLLLMLAGAGDDLQGIKRGIMEIADGIVINKADGDNLIKAKAAQAEYASAIHLFNKESDEWIPKVLTCSSIEKTGLDKVYEMIESYINQSKVKNSINIKRQSQQIEIIREALNSYLISKAYQEFNIPSEIAKIGSKNRINPFKELNNLIKLIEK
ncbi:MAG: methylmalonyl Co-A mutase-associated GTPase MeaB [Bacteroidia bacterium]